jgi:hypothetical protein
MLSAVVSGPSPLERDEGEYAYAGELILQGIPLYSVASNLKLPGSYAAQAGIMAIFGQPSPGFILDSRWSQREPGDEFRFGRRVAMRCLKGSDSVVHWRCFEVYSDQHAD